MKNKQIAAFCAFIGGAIGLDKLYLTDFKKGWGMLIALISIAIFASWGTAWTVAWAFSIYGFVKAVQYLNMDDLKFQRKYNRVRTDSPPLLTTPTKSNSWGNSSQARSHTEKGITYFKEWNIEAALSEFIQASELNPHDGTTWFHMACCYSQLENKLAFDSIEKAVKYGFHDETRIKTHESLAWLRTQSEWKQFLENQYVLPLQLKKELLLNPIPEFRNNTNTHNK